MTVVGLSDYVLVEPIVARCVIDQTAATRRPKWKVIAFAVVGAITVAEIVLAAPYLDRAISALGRPDLRWLALALVAELMSLGAFARVQRRMLAAGGARVPMRRMAALTYAANAVSRTFPGGQALSSGYVFRRLRSWGASVPAAGFTLLASGVLSTLSFALLAVVGAVLAGDGGLSSMLVVAGAAIAAIAAAIGRRHHKPDLVVRVASRSLVHVNRIMRRAPEAGLAGLHRVVRDLSAIKPRNRDWLAGFGFAGLNWIADLVCLLACCHAVGASGSSLALVTVAFIAGMSTSGLSLLPGGLGVVDAAMIIALTQGGVSTVPATSAVLLYRLISFAFVVALGWLVWGATWLAEYRSSAQTVSAARPDPNRTAVPWSRARGRATRQPASVGTGGTVAGTGEGFDRLGNDRSGALEHLGQQTDEPALLRLGERGQGAPLDRVQPRDHLVGDGAALGGDLDQNAAAVVGVRASPDPATPLEHIEQRGHRGRRQDHALAYP